MTKERVVKQAVRCYLDGIGAYYFMPVQSGYGSVTLDFLVCHKGRFYGIETKAPGINRATERQDWVMDKIKQSGGKVCLENSTGCEAVKEMMR